MKMQNEECGMTNEKQDGNPPTHKATADEERSNPPTPSGTPADGGARDIVDMIDDYNGPYNEGSKLLERARAEIVELRKVVDKTLFNAKAQKREGAEE